MLTPFRVGWILAETLSFDEICELCDDGMGKFFPEIALGVVAKLDSHGHHDLLVSVLGASCRS